MAIALGAYGPGDPRIIGSTAFTCDLCMATGPKAEPCPFHAEKSWGDWFAEAVREWALTTIRALRTVSSGSSSDPADNTDQRQ